ncbi:MAG: 30S ribosomal protein S5 [Candidatus Campbellbacteria bacterium]|nr:30S ribosomal protein S5 [Candidatus Campbellbacteria bacterium]
MTTDKTKEDMTEKTNSPKPKSEGKEGSERTSSQSYNKDSARVSRYGDPSKRQSKEGAENRRGGGRKQGKRFNKKGDRPRPEFDQKIVSIRRVTRVVAGGRRFSFSVSLVAGDRKGSVGVGIGKASDTALAIEKAFRDAKSSMVKIKRTEEGSIPHDVEARYTSSHVLLRPSKGKGLVAGSSVRTVLDFAGIKDVSGKLISRSKNKLNNARATVKALEKFGVVERQEKPASSEESENKEETQSRS